MKDEYQSAKRAPRKGVSNPIYTIPVPKGGFKRKAAPKKGKNGVKKAKYV